MGAARPVRRRRPRSFRPFARLADRGFREIVLTGVDLTSYGADLGDEIRLGGLVKAIPRAAPASSGCGCRRSTASRPTST